MAYFGSVYFRKESEPYMTVALAGNGEEGWVIVSETNLKFIWDVVAAIKVGKAGYSYVLDANGRLIAHPDISLVLQKTDFRGLPQVAPVIAKSARTAVEGLDAQIGRDIRGKEVLSAHALIEPLDLHVYVDLPIDEAYEPIFYSALRTVGLVIISLGVSILAALYLVRRMVAPVKVLQEGAARIASGELTQRIEVTTGDELQELADEFNRMTGQLQESYAGLERKVDERTRELTEALEQQTATSEVLRVISGSQTDTHPVFDIIAERARALCAASGVGVTTFDGHMIHLAALSHITPEGANEIRKRFPRPPGLDTATSRAILEREMVIISNVAKHIEEHPGYALKDAALAQGFNSVLAVPLLRDGTPIGAITIMRLQKDAFTPREIDMVKTFADQAVIAIENVRLFKELQARTLELENASKHKSQFLANMSHELRTPLNAILGYAELIVDKIYGGVPAPIVEVLERVQKSWRHLLGLINDVLDLSKIEAGQIDLSVSSFTFQDIASSVHSATESLASEKGLALSVEVEPATPVANGDERRLTQVLMNLVGNAIKFTDSGKIAIRVSPRDSMFLVSVQDTGPGIPADQHEKIFEEFQQVDTSATRKKGGTGLGLAISKRIVEMHGGRLWVESEVGAGSTFNFTIPMELKEVVA